MTVPLPLAHRGKVRDVYDAGEGRLLMVASDRLSAFDVVMAEPVPDKGRVLTAMSAFWFGELAEIAPNHLLSTDVADLGFDAADLVGRMMLVRRCEMLPVECIVRGYLAGSAWAEYRTRGSVGGVLVPEGLREADELPEPLFTPTTKAPSGDHDESITFDEMVRLVGAEAAVAARDISLAVFDRATSLARRRGLLLADTKLELGFLDGRLVLADEVVTPDSSRFWLAEARQAGRLPPSFDKQPVRDWLDATGWDHRPPPPALPDDVITATRTRYVEAYERLTGRRFADWPGSPAP